MTTSPARGPLPRWGAALVDAGCIVAFIAGGLVSHEEAMTLGTLALTSLSFISARALMLLYPTTSLALWPAGVIIWLGTWGFGMALRVVMGGGVAVAFLLVSLGVLGALLLGWRLVAGLLSLRARAQRAARAHAAPARGD